MKLTITDLTKCYGSKCVTDHINLELTPGIIGLLGPNGAGKTTLIRLMCDLIRPDAGGVYLDGENIADMGEAYRNVLGYLPQKVGYYPWFSAEKYLLYIAALKGLSKADAKVKTAELLRKVGLYEERKKRLSAYSGGMIQRVGIAQALLNDPKILILDEPTAGLDPQERIRFRTMIAGLAKDCLVILSTHIVTDVEHIASKVILLKSGQVVAYDTIDKILEPLSGQVCSLLVSDAEAEKYREQYLVSNMQPTENGILMRMVCPDRIPEGAVPVSAELEDAYIAYCGKDIVCKK
ncbi:MAG: ABC transporter ATP-binding protein [Lachnospiraceae bacterium]